MVPPEINPGDKIRSDLDGLIYEVVRVGSRDEIDPLPGIKQIGDALIVKDEQGNKQVLFMWEVELLEEK